MKTGSIARAALATWLGVCTALIGACTADRLRPVDPAAAPGTDAGSGYVLASVTLGGGRNALFSLRAIDGSTKRSVTALDEGVVRFHDDFSDDPQVRGRLMLITLPAGHYELTNWALLLGTRSHARRWLQPATLPPIPFSVRGNEVVYLGNLHVAVETADAGDVLPVDLLPVVSAGARIDDRAERDLAMFRERYPTLIDVPLRASVKTRPEWALRIRR